MKRRDFMMLMSALLPLVRTPGALAAKPATVLELAGVEAFIGRMRQAHGFVPGELRAFFSRLEVSDRVIELMERPAKPATKVYWREYRKRLTPRLIAEGVKFIGRHRQTLARTERHFGVPAEIIAAILGIETRYGKVLGDFVTARALSTLAFAYPRRAEEFLQELADFLIYARQSKIDPMVLRGSFAGAFGMPQFLPSSARQFAVDFDNNGSANLFTVADAAASIGNFLQAHGWQPGGAISYPVTAIVRPEELVAATRDNAYKPLFTPQQLSDKGVQADGKIAEGLYLLVDLENRYDTEYRLGGESFYALTRYNKSFNYAAAVVDLSREIAASG